LHKTDSMLAVLAMFRLARGIRFEVKGMLLWWQISRSL
jgi:hypothetical protein